MAGTQRNPWNPGEPYSGNNPPVVPVPTLRSGAAAYPTLAETTVRQSQGSIEQALRSGLSYDFLRASISIAGLDVTVTPAGGTPPYDIDWGDGGADDTGVTGATEHTYLAGDYEITITDAGSGVVVLQTGDLEAAVVLTEPVGLSTHAAADAWLALYLEITGHDRPDSWDDSTVAEKRAIARALYEHWQADH